ncbi:MAG: ATP-dependent protease ATPase subunit HslU [Spirochaetales bacterium]|nr:ATP-dependent protease ATPase subunit HslU [Spirochaetales bacterium]
MKRDLDTLTPREIVRELDKYIIGQEKAKKAVAIALRNRMRRQKLSDEMRMEVAPKNIIMMGPTGVGKTEIARRLSRLSGAPFIKVEASKFTEVGYVGRDVESMVRDLVAVAVSLVRTEMEQELKADAEKRTEEALLDLLLPGIKSGNGKKAAGFTMRAANSEETVQGGSDDKIAAKDGPSELIPVDGKIDKEPDTREKFKDMLKRGVLDDRMVEVNVSHSNMPTIEIFSGANLEDMGIDMGGLSNMFGKKKKKKKVSIKEARSLLFAEEMEKLLDTDKVNELARQRAENMGIIFIDEIDKIAVKEGRGGADVSREGVQRDILPIVEGSSVNTKYGMVDTSHMLFIAAGAFHMSKPSDLIPELQGRFPIRVELEDLTSDDFEKILTQPQNALITQYTELMKTEDVTLDFTTNATRRLSEIAAQVNSSTENIGARRLHTIMELLLEEISFDGPELAGQTISIDSDYVEKRLGDVVQDQDLSRYIL